MASTTATSTTYSMPEMSDNVIIIDLNDTGSQTYWEFSDDQDVIFIGADETRTDKLQVQGGHNVAVLGGDYQNDDGSTGTLSFYGTTGTVYVDGVHINNENSSGTDGIDIAGGENTSLIVQNSIIENINGSTDSGQHADAIQTQGNVGGEIHIANVSISTDYQGIFISPQYDVNPSAVTLENVDMHYTSGTTNNGGTISYLLWTIDDTSAQTAVNWSFDNVYVEPRGGQDAGLYTVWPTTNSGAVENGDQISWPSLGYEGHVTVGDHESFVDASQIGTNFASDAETLLTSAGISYDVNGDGTVGTTDNSASTGTDTTDNGASTGTDTTDNGASTGTDTTDNGTSTGTDTTDNGTGTDSGSGDEGSTGDGENHGGYLGSILDHGDLDLSAFFQGLRGHSPDGDNSSAGNLKLPVSDALSNMQSSLNNLFGSHQTNPTHHNSSDSGADHTNQVDSLHVAKTADHWS